MIVICLLVTLCSHCFGQTEVSKDQVLNRYFWNDPGSFSLKSSIQLSGDFGDAIDTRLFSAENAADIVVGQRKGDAVELQVIPTKIVLDGENEGDSIANGLEQISPIIVSIREETSLWSVKNQKNPEGYYVIDNFQIFLFELVRAKPVGQEEKWTVQLTLTDTTTSQKIECIAAVTLEKTELLLSGKSLLHLSYLMVYGSPDSAKKEDVVLPAKDQLRVKSLERKGKFTWNTELGWWTTASFTDSREVGLFSVRLGQWLGTSHRFTTKVKSTFSSKEAKE